MKGEILRLLKNNAPEFISGELICRQLGVSRAAIWKHISALRGDGYIIKAQTNAGYRLESSPDRLYPEEVRSDLGTTILGRQIHYFDSLGSTNAVAKDLAREGCAEGALVLAEEQNGGRGRLGRGWFAPHARGIWASLVLRPAVSPADVPQLTLITAVALARALRRETLLPVGIKWPNDLLAGGKKICGILTEMSADMDRVNYAVVGFGLNVNIRREDFPPELSTIATSLCIEAGKIFSRLALLKAILDELENKYLTWLNQGFAPLLTEWREMCVTIDCPVTVHTLKERWDGYAEGVNESGALLVRTPGGELRCLIAGEVSLRI
jgi:BirA family biotin operon repressor/biotin-[acetyl-CoA-carboxylase] ligase